MVLLPTYVAGVDPPFPVYYEQALEQVELAEELGFSCFWFTEHHFIPYGGPIPNPSVFIAAAAARTSRIRLGCSVSVLPLHHPLHAAEDYAMADALSHGRLEFGMGVGNNRSEYEQLGVAPDEGRSRFAEAQAIILGAWSQERFSYEGQFWRCEDVALYPRPAQTPHPPIWIAGSSEATFSLAGRRGFNIMTVAHPREPEAVRPGVAAWRAGLAEAGLEPASRHCLIHLRGFVDENAQRAARVAESAITCYEQLSAHGLGRAPSTQAYDWAGMLATGRNVYGDPDGMIEAMRQTTRHFDFDTFGMGFNFGGIPHTDVVKAMRLFAREVMPAFA